MIVLVKMTKYLEEKLDKLQIRKDVITDEPFVLTNRLAIQEVCSIFLDLMATQTDKSEIAQCRCAVIASVTHHQSSRRRHSGNCYNACEAIITAARLAFEYQLEDPVMEELFRALYECNGSFAALLFSQREEAAESNADVEYFLSQATRMKLSFKVHHELRPMLECPLNRMYSTFRPIEGAIDNERFDDWELMVRYGACLNYDTAFGDPISVADMALNLVFQCYNPDKDEFSAEPKLAAYFGILRVLLRAVPRVDYPTPQHFRDQSMFATDEREIKQKQSMFAKLQRDGIVAAGMAGKEPPTLQHLSRLVIRQRLYDAWSLPSGIGKLGLPLRLQEYLDLKTG